MSQPNSARQTKSGVVQYTVEKLSSCSEFRQYTTVREHSRKTLNPTQTLPPTHPASFYTSRHHTLKRRDRWVTPSWGSLKAQPSTREKRKKAKKGGKIQVRGNEMATNVYEHNRYTKYICCFIRIGIHWISNRAV